MKPVSSPFVVSVAISWILVAPAFPAPPQPIQKEPTAKKERKVSTNQIPSMKEFQEEESHGQKKLNVALVPPTPQGQMTQLERWERSRIRAAEMEPGL